MSRRLKVMGGGFALLLTLTLTCGAFAAPQETPPAPQPAAPQTATAAPQAEALPSCSDCHELAKAFVANPHARGEVKAGVVPNEVCETCHSGAAEHIEAGGDPTKITVPRGLQGANDTCLVCHDVTTDRRSHRTGAHANSPQVNCLSCHSIHNHQQAVKLLVRPEPALCASCHATQAASLRNKPYAHHIGRAGLTCSSCHEPHGRPGRENNLRRTAAGEVPCLGCHSDKRGPFVFEHGAVQTGECWTCHEPHGSNNPKQLRRATVAQQCIECHSPITAPTLGSQPPSFHNLSLPRYQNCTTCHVAVHGSNRSPQLLK